MIPPPSFLWIFGASFHVESVIRGSAFFFGRGQHGDDGQTDGLHGQSRGPVICQDGEANVAVAVNVVMDWDGLWRSNKSNLWRIKRILHSEFELNDKVFSLIEGVRGTRHFHLPDPQVITIYSVTVQFQPIRGVSQETFKFFL